MNVEFAAEIIRGRDFTRAVKQVVAATANQEIEAAFAVYDAPRRARGYTVSKVITDNEWLTPDGDMAEDKLYGPSVVNVGSLTRIADKDRSDLLMLLHSHVPRLSRRDPVEAALHPSAADLSAHEWQSQRNPQLASGVIVALPKPREGWEQVHVLLWRRTNYDLPSTYQQLGIGMRDSPAVILRSMKESGIPIALLEYGQHTKCWLGSVALAGTNQWTEDIALALAPLYPS